MEDKNVLGLCVKDDDSFFGYMSLLNLTFRFMACFKAYLLKHIYYLCVWVGTL